MKKNIAIKSFITLLVAYEFVTVLTLYFSPFCDLLFSMCGFQYIVLCLLVPIIFTLLFFWRKELGTLLKLKENIMIICLGGIMFISLALYLIAKPKLVDMSKFSIHGHTQLCLDNIAKERAIAFGDKDTCYHEALVAKSMILNKQTITSKEFRNVFSVAAITARTGPKYANTSCKDIAFYEKGFCRNARHTTKDERWCQCFGNIVAFWITSGNLNQYCINGICTNEDIRQRLPELRDIAKKRCDIISDKEKYSIDSRLFCQQNGL